MAEARRQFDAKFKSRVALEAMRGLKTPSEIAEQYKVHPNQVTLWKKQLIEGAKALFERNAGNRKNSNDDPEFPELHEQIGQLKIELDWLRGKIAENS